MYVLNQNLKFSDKMRFNDRELLDICSTNPVFEGRLNYRSPSGNFGQSGFKERWFRLTCNLLFYFRINEAGKVDAKPSGVFVLENSNIQLEQSSSIPFAFSITFRDEPERKHIFSGRSDASVKEWITSMKHCSYEYLRTQRILLQKKITLKTGKDPLLMYPYNEGVIRDFQLLPDLSDDSAVPLKPPQPLQSQPSQPLKAASALRTSFHSHLEPLVLQQSTPKGNSSVASLSHKTSASSHTFQSHVGLLNSQKISSKQGPSMPEETQVQLRTASQSHVRPLVPQRSAPKLPMTFQPHAGLLIPQRIAPNAPLPKIEMQSSSVVPSTEVNLIEF